MHSEERIEDFEAYFFGCYKVKNMVKVREEQHYTYPGDEFLLLCTLSDAYEETFKKTHLSSNMSRLLFIICNE